MGAEHATDALHLGNVAGGRRGAVGVDVVDLLQRDARIPDRGNHAAAAALAILAGRGHVPGVATHAEAGQLTIDAGAALHGMLVVLDHQYPGAVGQHEAVTVPVPRPAGAFGLVVAGGQRTRRAEAADRGADGGV